MSGFSGSDRSKAGPSTHRCLLCRGAGPAHGDLVVISWHPPQGPDPGQRAGMKWRTSKASGHQESLSWRVGFDSNVEHLALKLYAFGYYDDSSILLTLCQNTWLWTWRPRIFLVKAMPYAFIRNWNVKKQRGLETPLSFDFHSWQLISYGRSLRRSRQHVSMAHFDHNVASFLPFINYFFLSAYTY